MSHLQGKILFVFTPFFTQKIKHHGTHIGGQSLLVPVLQFDWTTCGFFCLFNLNVLWFNSTSSKLLANYGGFVFNLWMFYIILIDISGLLNYLCTELNLKGFLIGSCVKSDECTDECEWIKTKI